MTTFARLQEAYAARRVATYPLTDSKTPAISHYARVGVDASQQLAIKFAASTAAGFVAGRRNRLTVVDIDSHDEKLVAEIEGRYGPSPFAAQTPGGGWHLYYRHNGEARRIRPLPDVDILGAGNVVAALSIVPKGRYQIVRGSLDDLDRLPPMRREGAAPSARIGKGERNNRLFHYCKSVVDHCDDLDQLLDAAQTWADGTLAEPLPQAEIARTCQSVWTYRGGRKRIMDQIVEAPQFKALMADPVATTLFVFLRAENGEDAEFMVADGLGQAMGWPRRFVPTARKALIELGIITCVRPPGDGRAAMYRWAV
jgi:Bifunctional DNA primase/polymerase, N-terminal/Primase C terminal 1 (PriCT-1)